MGDVSVFDAAGVQRVLLGQIGTGAAPDYGLKIVAPDGSTTIIDGTSDVFKISATGTLTRAFPAAGSANVANVILTALGANFSVAFAMLAMVQDDNTIPGVGTTVGIKHTSNFATGATKWKAYAMSDINPGPPGSPEVQLFAESDTTNPGTTAAVRYYLLAEIGL